MKKSEPSNLNMNSKEAENLVEMGICEKPHSIKGGMTFKLYNDEESILQPGMTLYLFPLNEKSELPSSGQPFTIHQITFGHKVIVYLKEIENRTQLEDILPFSIKVPRSQFPEIQQPDQYYLADLLGLSVSSFDTKENIGKVDHFYENGAQTILVVKGPRGQLIEVPFLDPFLKNVDLSEKKIYISLPQYLD